MYKQSHNNNDIEFMIFVLLIEGRIFCIIFGIFFSCIIYNFHKELPLAPPDRDEFPHFVNHAL